MRAFFGNLLREMFQQHSKQNISSGLFFMQSELLFAMLEIHTRKYIALLDIQIVNSSV